jgi:hypothetical protein
MLPRIAIAGLAAATLVAAAALIPTGAAAGGGAHGGAGNWPQSGTWNWPEYAGAQTCTWTQVKHFSHGKTFVRWERLCP